MAGDGGVAQMLKHVDPAHADSVRAFMQAFQAFRDETAHAGEAQRECTRVHKLYEQRAAQERAGRRRVFSLHEQQQLADQLMDAERKHEHHHRSAHTHAQAAIRVYPDAVAAFNPDASSRVFRNLLVEHAREITTRFPGVRYPTTVPT